VNFGEQTSVPRHFLNRLFYNHNPQVTLMRTTPEECHRLGIVLAEKVNASIAPVTVMIPIQGISVISAAGGPFYDPAADSALFNSLANTLRPGIRIVNVDATINAPEFAKACVEELLANISDSCSVLN
jgi:uncharacterized protein (UPF0261 family)